MAAVNPGHPTPPQVAMGVQNGDPSADILGAPLYLPHDARHGGSRMPWDPVIVNDNESDYGESDDSPSDTAPPSPGKDVNTPPGGNSGGDTKDPSNTGGASAGDDGEPDCAERTCRQCLGCPDLSDRDTAGRRAKADNSLHPSHTLPGGPGTDGTGPSFDGRGLPQRTECAGDGLPSAKSERLEQTLCSDRDVEDGQPELPNVTTTLQLSESQINPRGDAGGHCKTNLGGDGGEQHKDGLVVPPQAQESRASMANTETSTPANQDNIGHCRRRRNADDEEDCSPIVGSDTNQDRDEDIVQPPEGKRLRVGTSVPTATAHRRGPQRQTRLRSTNSPPLQARRQPSTQDSKRHRIQRKSLKRTASTMHASTARQVYFPVEAILDWRQSKEGRKYLVKWEGYADEHNSWEPTAHFEKCPEVLEEFHQKERLCAGPSMRIPG